MQQQNRRHCFRGLALGIALLLGATSARAAGTAIPHGTLELVAENSWIAPGREFALGLRFQLEKGWHVYWVNPGDSGEPARIEWKLPAGITAGEIEWPTPQRLGSGTVVDYGYEDAVLLMVPGRAAASVKSQAAAQLTAEVKLLVCSHEMCIPGKAEVALTLPVKADAPVADARTEGWFATARKALPRTAPAGWKFSVTEAKDSFVLAGNVGRRVMQAVFFPLEESQIENAAAQTFSPTANGFRLTLRKSDQLLKPISRLKGVLVISDSKISDSKISGSESYRIDAAVGGARRIR